jgi:hypothetical protein
MRLRWTMTLLLALGCGSRQIPGVVERKPGEALTHLPGPMPDFGPFQTYSDALLAACPKIISLPHAVASRPSDPNFELRWKLSKEYCAWIYYTPDGLYEMSMLTTRPFQDDPRRRQCNLPSFIRDSRYSDDSLGYVFVVHNHPVGNEPSSDDIRFIVGQGLLHGFVVKTHEREIPLGIVAFFARTDTDTATCAGFFLYMPVTGEVLKWTADEHGEWTKKQYGKVTWKNASDFDVERLP